jgi:hypothetical protein
VTLAAFASRGLYLLGKMPCIALRALINPKVAGAAGADQRVSPSLCTFLVKTNLSARAAWSTQTPIGGIECFFWFPLHNFALIAPTPAVVLFALEHL